MKFQLSSTIQIGDIQAFKKMLAEAIHQKSTRLNTDRRFYVCYNDHYYPRNRKVEERID